jgi:hypothetical protein
MRPKITSAIFANSEGWKEIPAIEHQRLEPWIWVPIPGINTRTSITMDSANAANETLRTILTGARHARENATTLQQHAEKLLEEQRIRRSIAYIRLHRGCGEHHHQPQHVNAAVIASTR